MLRCDYTGASMVGFVFVFMKKAATVLQAVGSTVLDGLLSCLLRRRFIQSGRVWRDKKITAVVDRLAARFFVVLTDCKSLSCSGSENKNNQ